ncbi:MAG: class B sortase [Coriobacteriales bacterium]|nr:class B sortase [Coriobacteriales bacterium]
MSGEEGERGIVAFAHTFVRFLLRVLYVLVAVVFTLMFVVGVYALWDSHTIDEKASAIYWQPFKPVEPEALSFHELQAINPDVVAWLTLYGTNIDYPVCYSTDINWYLTHDAEGKVVASGALFIDPEDPPDFSDFSTLVYGHHMEHNIMFGQIADFKRADVFGKYHFGNLYAGGRSWGIHVFCMLEADAYDPVVYRRGLLGDAGAQQQFIDLLHERAVQWRDIGVKPGDRLILMSTCASTSTNGRDILVGRIDEQVYENAFEEWPNTGTGVDAVPGWLGIPWYGWLCAVLLAAFIGTYLFMRARSRS